MSQPQVGECRALNCATARSFRPERPYGRLSATWTRGGGFARPVGPSLVLARSLKPHGPFSRFRILLFTFYAAFAPQLFTPNSGGLMFRGAITALVTPFKNGAIDEEAYRALIEWQIEQGIDGLLPCGTTANPPLCPTRNTKKPCASASSRSKAVSPSWPGPGPTTRPRPYA